MFNQSGDGGSSWLGSDGKRYANSNSQGVWGGQHGGVPIIDAESNGRAALPNRTYTFTISYKLHNYAGGTNKAAKMQAYIGIKNGVTQSGFEGIYPSNSAYKKSDVVTVWSTADGDMDGTEVFTQTLTVDSGDLADCSPMMGVYIELPAPSITSEKVDAYTKDGTATTAYRIDGLEVEIVGLTVTSTPPQLTVDYLEDYKGENDLTLTGNTTTYGSMILYPGQEYTFGKGQNGGQMNKWYQVVIFDWDATQKCYVKIGHSVSGETTDFTIPATGFAYVLHWTGNRDDYTGAMQMAYDRALVNQALIGEANTWNSITLANGTKAYLYGIDLYEGYLDSKLTKDVYNAPKGKENHLNDTEYWTNAKISLGVPLAGVEAFDPEQPPVETEVEFTYGGVSILTDSAAENAGHQALRVYYGYKLNDNDKIEFGGKEYSLKERGILISKLTNINGNITLENVDETIIRTGKTEDFDKCWIFDDATNTVIYSNYIIGFDFTDTRRFKFRGYIILDDGTESGKVIYTDAVSTSVVEISGNDIVDDVSYVEDYEMFDNWGESLTRLQALNYNFAFGVQTDTHFALGDTSGYGYAYSGYSLSALSRKDNVNLDYIVNLGDILKGYDNPVLDNKFNLIQSAKALDKRFTTGTTCPVLYAVGNHDNNIMWARAQNDENEIITKKELYDIFGKSVQNTTSNAAVFDGETMYYYLDFPEKGIRAIMLDTNDLPDTFAGTSGSSAISDKQLAWFRDVALDTEYSVIIMAHVPLIKEDGFNEYYVTNSDGILAATDAFKAAGGEIVGFFYGHQHEQRDTVYNDDNHIIFMNTGRIAEVITLDTTTKTINTVAFGWGTRDRTFSYAQ